MFSKLHHVAIICTDYNKSKEFYVQKLGFEIIREHKRADKDDYKIDLKLGDIELELFIKKDAPNRLNYPEAAGLRHVAFHVSNVDEIVLELKSKGIDCEPVRLDDYTNKKMTFFKDPDNLPIEIHE